jgi:hypothetical protein
MNVKAFLAGKRGICPHCDARWNIPLESEIPDGAPKIRPEAAAKTDDPPQNVAASPSTTTAPTSELADDSPIAIDVVTQTAQDPIDALPHALWYVRPSSGGEFGPAKGDVMRRWIEEGRVGADSMVWREGWPEWQIAGPIFPSLAASAEQPTATVSEPTQSVMEPKTLASLASIQKKTVESNGRAARQRSAGSRKSIAAIVILGLMIVALFVVLLLVVPK